MKHPQWDDEMKFELFRFRSELRIEDIRVLAQPLGLGLLPLEPEEARSLYPKLAAPNLNGDTPARAFQQLRQSTAVLQPSRPKAQDMKVSSQLRPETLPQRDLHSIQQAEPAFRKLKGSSAKSRWLYLVLAHCVDLGFIGVCLAMGFLVLIGMIDPSSLSLKPHILSQSLPLQFLSHISPWLILLGVYVIFACYWLFFKIISGLTLGETYLHNFNHGSDQLQEALYKESGDS